MQDNGTSSKAVQREYGLRNSFENRFEKWHLSGPGPTSPPSPPAQAPRLQTKPNAVSKPGKQTLNSSYTSLNLFIKA